MHAAAESKDAKFTVLAIDAFLGTYSSKVYSWNWNSSVTEIYNIIKSFPSSINEIDEDNQYKILDLMFKYDSKDKNDPATVFFQVLKDYVKRDWRFVLYEKLNLHQAFTESSLKAVKKLSMRQAVELVDRIAEYKSKLFGLTIDLDKTFLKLMQDLVAQHTADLVVIYDILSKLKSTKNLTKEHLTLLINNKNQNFNAILKLITTHQYRTDIVTFGGIIEDAKARLEKEEQNKQKRESKAVPIAPQLSVVDAASRADAKEPSAGSAYASLAKQPQPNAASVTPTETAATVVPHVSTTSPVRVSAQAQTSLSTTVVNHSMPVPQSAPRAPAKTTGSIVGALQTAATGLPIAAKEVAGLMKKNLEAQTGKSASTTAAATKQIAPKPQLPDNPPVVSHRVPEPVLTDYTNPFAPPMFTASSSSIGRKMT